MKTEKLAAIVFLALAIVIAMCSIFKDAYHQLYIACAALLVSLLYYFEYKKQTSHEQHI